MPCADGGRDWSDVSTSRGMLRIAGKHQKLVGGKERVLGPLSSMWPFYARVPAKDETISFFTKTFVAEKSLPLLLDKHKTLRGPMGTELDTLSFLRPLGIFL